MATLGHAPEKQRVEALRQELADRILAAGGPHGILEIFAGVFLASTTSPTEWMYSVFSPALCIIAQGSKEVHLGDEVFRYDTGHYLIATADLPISSCVADASVEKPYLSLRIDLDPAIVADVLIESGSDVHRKTWLAKAMDVSSIDADLLDAAVRILRLLDKSGEEKVLLPLIRREIVYRLLQGNQAPRLAHLVSGGENRRISRAIETLRAKFDQPLRIEDIARDLGMSVSGFHHHFKAVTAMSPLQFQKQMRLQEARRLMLGEDLDAATAGFRVGYEDPSYFSRDYKKAFGAPPQRDIARLRVELRA